MEFHGLRLQGREERMYYVMIVINAPLDDRYCQQGPEEELYSVYLI